MTKRISFLLILFLLTCIVISHPVFSQTETPLWIQSSFYTPGNGVSSVESIAAWGNCIYLCARYLNGDQKLETWNVRDPAHPEFIDAIDFGNLAQNATNHWRFPSLNIFDDVFIVRSNFSDLIYHADSTGKLILDEASDFAASICEFKNNEESIIMSAGGNFGVYFGRIYDPLTVPPEMEYGYKILNFTNPKRPFLSIMDDNVVPWPFADTISGHLDGVLGNNPALLGIKDNQFNLLERSIKTESFFDVFWAPRLPKLFHTDTLSRTLREEVEHLVNNQSVPDHLSRALDRFLGDLELEADASVQGVIETNYALQDPLTKLMQDYEINLNDTVRIGIEKLVSHHLTLDLEKELSQEIFNPLLNDWMDDLLAVPIPSSPGELKQFVSGVLNEGLSEETVARYLLDNYIAPYVDTPDWMHWTMQEVVDRIAESPLGEVITAGVAAGYASVSSDIFLQATLELVPPAKQFYLPAGFPKDCRDVLNYAFFEHGAKLKRDGLAFMELLKFYQYYEGNEDYLNYENLFSEEIRQLQEELSRSVSETLEPFLSSLSFVGNFQERLQTYSASLPCRESLVKAIADSLCERLRQAGVDVNESIHDVFIQHRLYLTIYDAYNLKPDDLAQAEDLIRVLQQDLQLADVRIADLWNAGKGFTDRLESSFRRALTDTIQNAWGKIDLDRPMMDGLQEYFGTQVDFKWNFGDNMDRLLKDFVFSSFSEFPGFVENIAVFDRAVDGDVIARWQITFEAAKDAAALIPYMEEKALEYELIEKALDEVYKQAASGAIKMVLSEFASIMGREMFGSFSSWATTMDEKAFTFDLEELLSITPIESVPFVWENYAGIVSRESWDLLHPRKISLVLFDPTHPEDSKLEYVSEKVWGSVDTVLFSDGVVLVGGSRLVNGLPISTALFVALDDRNLHFASLANPAVSATKGMVTANHGSTLVVYGPGGVFLFANPRSIAPPEPPARVETWKLTD